jgi:hypothetical protein
MYQDIDETYSEVTSSTNGLAVIRGILGTVESTVFDIDGVVDTIDGHLGAPASPYPDISHMITQLNNALPYPNAQANDVHADINRAIADILLGNALSGLIGEAVGVVGSALGTLNTVIGIVFPNAAGSSTTINFNSSLVASGNVPPLDSLTVGSAVSLGSGANVDIPVGTYGYRFNLAVPSYWARRGDETDDLSPSVITLEFLHDAYSFANPVYVRRENWLAYPLHPAANRFTVDLAPGVTGTYTPLTL